MDRTATLGPQRPEQRHAALEQLDALPPHHLGEDLLAVVETTDRERTRRIMRIAPGQIDAARLEQRAQAVDILQVALGQAAGPEGRAARACRQKAAEQKPSSSCFQGRACTTALRVSASSRSNRQHWQPADRTAAGPHSQTSRSMSPPWSPPGLAACGDERLPASPGAPWRCGLVEGTVGQGGRRAWNSPDGGIREKD